MAEWNKLMREVKNRKRNFESEKIRNGNVIL